MTEELLIHVISHLEFFSTKDRGPYVQPVVKWLRDVEVAHNDYAVRLRADLGLKPNAKSLQWRMEFVVNDINYSSENLRFRVMPVSPYLDSLFPLPNWSRPIPRLKYFRRNGWFSGLATGPSLRMLDVLARSEPTDNVVVTPALSKTSRRLFIPKNTYAFKALFIQGVWLHPMRLNVHALHVPVTGNGVEIRHRNDNLETAKIIHETLTHV